MKNKGFSLSIYLLVVLIFSWPFQFGYLFLGEAFRPLLLVSMITTGVATFICGKYIFKDGFAKSGWKWGKPKHYLYTFLLPLFLWLVPILIEQLFGLSMSQSVNMRALLRTFLFSFLITLIPAFGEEFSWRGYLLPHLMKVHPPKKALLIHGFITWFWHLPAIVAMGMQTPGNPLITVPAVSLISLIPTIMHAVVFAYFWSVAKSLVVSTVYHSAFDEVRDTLQDVVGFGPLVEVWQMVTLTLLGIIFLLETKWIKRN